MPKYFFCACLLVMLQVASAYELSEPRILSYLDEELRIEVAVIGTEGDIRLASPDDYLRLGLQPINVPLNLELVSDAEKNNAKKLLITSNDIITNPAFVIVIEATGQEGDVFYDIPVLLDFKNETVSQVTSTNNVATNQASADEVVVSKTLATQPVVDTTPTIPTSATITKKVTQYQLIDQTYGPVKLGESLWGIAGELTGGNLAQRNQMIKALQLMNPQAFTPEGALKSGVTLNIPDLTSGYTIDVSIPESGNLQNASVSANEHLELVKIEEENIETIVKKAKQAVTENTSNVVDQRFGFSEDEVAALYDISKLGSENVQQPSNTGTTTNNVPLAVQTTKPQSTTVDSHRTQRVTQGTPSQSSFVDPDLATEDSSMLKNMMLIFFITISSSAIAAVAFFYLRKRRQLKELDAELEMEDNQFYQDYPIITNAEKTAPMNTSTSSELSSAKPSRPIPKKPLSAADLPRSSDLARRNASLEQNLTLGKNVEKTTLDNEMQHYDHYHEPNKDFDLKINRPTEPSVDLTPTMHHKPDSLAGIPTSRELTTDLSTRSGTTNPVEKPVLSKEEGVLHFDLDTLLTSDVKKSQLFDKVDDNELMYASEHKISAPLPTETLSDVKDINTLNFDLSEINIKNTTSTVVNKQETESNKTESNKNELLFEENLASSLVKEPSQYAETLQIVEQLSFDQDVSSNVGLSNTTTPLKAHDYNVDDGLTFDLSGINVPQLDIAHDLDRSLSAETLSSSQVISNIDTLATTSLSPQIEAVQSHVDTSSLDLEIDFSAFDAPPTTMAFDGIEPMTISSPLAEALQPFDKVNDPLSLMPTSLVNVVGDLKRPQSMEQQDSLSDFVIEPSLVVSENNVPPLAEIAIPAEPILVTNPIATNMLASENLDVTPVMQEDDSVNESDRVKLELAEAYMAFDASLAKPLLIEVLEEGSPAYKARAQALLQMI